MRSSFSVRVLFLSITMSQSTLFWDVVCELAPSVDDETARLDPGGRDLDQPWKWAPKQARVGKTTPTHPEHGKEDDVCLPTMEAPKGPADAWSSSIEETDCEIEISLLRPLVISQEQQASTG